MSITVVPEPVITVVTVSPAALTNAAALPPCSASIEVSSLEVMLPFSPMGIAFRVWSLRIVVTWLAFLRLSGHRICNGMFTVMARAFR